jgi:cell division protein FtsN
MSRNTGNKSAAPRKGGNSIWTGVLVGIMVGVCMAVGVAWYQMKSPKPFVNKEQPAAAKPQPEPTKPSTSAATDKSTIAPGDGKQRFEFYKMLTDKQGAMVPAKPADKPRATDKTQPAKSQPEDTKSAAFNELQILQAGSFSNVNDAEKLKAKLALLGVEASIQTATIPDKGVWYRVRLGPYKNADDMNHTRGFLKQNGVESTPMRAQ